MKHICECGCSFELWNPELECYVCAECGTILTEGIELLDEDDDPYNEYLESIFYHPEDGLDDEGRELITDDELYAEDDE